MDSGKQQIVCYFIEEAKEHLETLEKGILDLENAIQDSERVNEMFRAAHSIKGGAAMLGFDSIKKVAHRFEDVFKIMQEQQIQVNQDVESMFLKGYDALHYLVDMLQNSGTWEEAEAQKSVVAAEANFIELQNYLNQSIEGSPALKEEFLVPKINITSEVTQILRQMLQVFKQKESAAQRQELDRFCSLLLALIEDNSGWTTLIETAQAAIASCENSFRTIAPFIIKEIKQASDTLVAQPEAQIAPSASLRLLAALAHQQIAIPKEPSSAAKTLLRAFDRSQINQLVVCLQNAA
ncbi:Hpt domain-containing protein [Merismopedia glauca]|uniref:Histidine kinase n=1 Tax=Merismopedia glauca CCAP 1448/3 TaxID=1296344 RepID=A0A2T1C9E1_9CYAN|nr:Hpt domain-containing protein [Merismopedia glauca]PSB04876.1 histidine kinase [Merismopedia glauca CCAP 1448/3]